MKNKLLLIDDFGLQPLSHTSRMAFLEILEDRHRRKSTIVISQQPVENWHGIIGDPHNCRRHYGSSRLPFPQNRDHRSTQWSLDPRHRSLVRIEVMLEELASGERPIGEVRLPELFRSSIEEGEKKDRLAALIRHLGGWLGVRTNLGIAGDYEQSLLCTDGENVLKHLAEDVSPTKSYKMAVLHALLDEAETGRVRTTWPADETAPAFLSYYLANRRRTKDYSALARSENPSEFPLPKVVTDLKKMSRDKLSNSPGKPFVLDGDSFILKDAYVPFWDDERFRALVRERVEYAEARYWYTH